MILELMRQERAWKTLPRAVTACTLAWLAATLLGGLGTVAFGIFATMFIGASGVVAVGYQNSMTSHLMALPVTVREVYSARLISLVSMIWLPLGAGSCVALLTGRVEAASFVALLTSYAALTTLLLIVAQALYIRRPDSPQWLLTLFAPLVFIPGSLIPSVRWNAGTMLAVAASACLLGAGVSLWTWQSLPPCFIYSPRSGSSRAVAPVSASAPRPNPWWPFLRSVYGWNYVVWPPLIMLQFTTQLSLMPSVYFAVIVSTTRRQVRWLLQLPVSRSLLFAAMIVPVLLTVPVGYLAGVNLFHTSGDKRLKVTEQTCGKPGFTMPPRFFEPAPNGVAPLVQAPWGEEFRPPVTVVAGLRVYNPYAVSCENSQQFITWQFRRADAARSRPPGFRQQVLDVALRVVLVLSIVLLVLLNDWHPVRRLSPTLRVAAFASVGVTGFILILLFSLPKSGDIDYAVVWLSNALPGFRLGVIAIPVAALYWACDKVFRGAEYADNPPPARFMSRC